jgi:hypothetical protein
MELMDRPHRLCNHSSRRHVLAGMAGAILGGCSLLPAYVYYFKINVYATIDGIKRVGTTTIRSEWYHGLGLDSGQKWVGHNYGDAITIAHDGERYVFALLGTIQGQEAGLNIDESLFLQYFPSPSSDNDGQELFQKMATLSGEQEIPRRDWPIVVGFTDVNVISTASFLGQESTQVMLDNVTFAVTDGPESNELPKKLLWFSQLGKFHPLDPAHPPQTLPAYQQLVPTNIHANGEQL